MSVQLTTLRLQNFRCFRDHTIELQPKTLLVGKNNAGKSTAVEALRLVSIVTERIGNLHLRRPPKWADLGWNSKGVSPSLDSIDIHASSLFHNYGEPPALVAASFSNGSRLDIHIGPEIEIHAVTYGPDGKAATTSNTVAAAQIPRVSILPQIAPLQENETIRDDAYVKKNAQTSRASLHFRNQLRVFSDQFPNFRSNVARTWPSLEIKSLELPNIGDKDTPLALIVRDGDFSAEVAWMGHGLQMWLQTIWFLTRNTSASVLILDEPDVYMHADLQRKLVRMLLGDSRQFIIATHSPEMLSEVQAESVVILDRKKSRSTAATTSAIVQQLLQHVGSVHNLSLARLANQRRILFVEGQDVPFLKLFQNAFDPHSERPIDTVPNTDIEGWSGWHSVLTLARFLRKNADGDFAIFCVLDRDYHTESEIKKRAQEAKDASIHLHIWSAKELENFAIVPGAIARVISKKLKHDIPPETVEAVIAKTTEGLKDETFDKFAESFRLESPKQGVAAANNQARRLISAKWSTTNGRYLVCGKDLFKSLAEWSQKEFGISLSLPAIITELRSTEVHEEVSDFIRSVTG